MAARSLSLILPVSHAAAAEEIVARHCRRSWREPSIAVSGSFLVSRLLSALLLAIPILGTLFIVWAIVQLV